jgi:PAS domain S-box-containing protein
MRQPSDGAKLVDPSPDAPAAGRDQAANPGVAARGPSARWSTRWHLAALVAAVLVPMLVFSGLLLWHTAQIQRRELKEDAVALADTLAANVDRQLQGFIWALQVLAASPALDRGDVEALYQHAAAAKGILDSEIIIKNVSGQQLVNTRLDPSAPLPASLPEGDRQAIATRRAVVSDLFIGHAARRPILSVIVPVVRDDRVVGLVIAGIDPTRLAAILGQAELPPDWLAAIIDGADRIIARSRRHEEFVGTPASKDLRENATSRRGVWIGSTAEGLPVLAAYARSTIADWRIAVGVPIPIVEEPLYRSLAWLLGIGALALTVSALLAGFFARRLIVPLRDLAVQAARVGHGESVRPTLSRVAEVVNVSAALEQASAELRRREAERRQAEAELHSSRARLERVLDTSPVGIVEVNPHGEFLYLNATAERILRAGRAELEGRRFQDIPWLLKTPQGETLSPRQFPGARALAGELVIGTELEMVNPADGRSVMLSVNASPVIENGRVHSALIAFGDISERYRAEQALLAAQSKLRALNENLEQRVAEEMASRQHIEEALRQSQKMEAIGQLTGGVAHDFNNLLTIILGNLENLENRLPPDDRLRRPVAAAIRGAARAAVLTDRLLAFSRRQPLTPAVIDVNALVAGMSDLLHGTLGEGIKVETRLGDGLWPAFVDASQLENALINLAVNGRDAMPAGGTLTIATENCEIAPTERGAPDDPPPGQYVHIAVSDTGCGMPEEVRAKAFEPFFTTKDIGHGTGLGLSQVYGFIKQSGGYVRICTAVGRGTTVRLYLPRRLETAEPAGETPPVPPPRGRSGETVLIVEDDPDVRAYSEGMIAELGYRVLTAGDAAAALAMIDTHAVDLLFTDVGLPGGSSGRQLAEAARQRHPQLKVLFTTGYARDAILQDGRLDPGIEIVFKPFRYSELALRIRRVLDA